MTQTSAPDSDRLGDWLAWLETLSPREIDLGLERTLAVLDRLALPRPRRVLHIGGTNGKGSTAAMLEALYRECGRRVGCYTSPHILDYNERMRCDGQPLPDADILAAFRRVEACRNDTPLTYFEYGTLAALVAFAAAGVDTVLLEVGLGGRLDAVNAVEPDGGIITNIALDHCAWLGDDRDSVAREKAGIMRANRPLVCADPDPPPAIGTAAGQTGAELLLVGRDFRHEARPGGWCWQAGDLCHDGLAEPALPGAWQRQNAAGALALFHRLEGAGALDTAGVNRALAALSLPGRLQRVGARWLLDVAHNPAAAAALADELRRRSVAPVVAVIGVLADKDLDGILGPLLPRVARWIAVPASSPRALPAADIDARLRALGADSVAADSVPAGLELAARESADCLLVTGSFFVIGPALRTLTADDGPAC